MDEPLTRFHRNLLTLLLPLSEWPQRAIAFGERIARASPEEASSLFSHICVDMCGSRTIDGEILAQSMFTALVHGFWDGEHRQHTREAAAGQDEPVTLALLQTPEYPDSDSEEFEVPKYNADRVLSLGERRSLASNPSRQAIERAMLDPHPMVATKLLDNPKLTEADVIRISAARLMAPSVLSQVAVHRKWRKRRAVQQALVNNRLLPVCFGVTLLPFLDIHTLRHVRRDARLHEDIQSAARVLLDAISTAK